MKFQRCPGCKIERPISNFTMALCIECRKVELPVETRYECVKAGRQLSYRSKRYAQVRQATPPWVDRAAIRAIYAEAKRLTKETGRPHEVDHIWPITHESFSGLHVPWNLRVIPAKRNSEKRNTPPLAFYSGFEYKA